MAITATALFTVTPSVLPSENGKTLVVGTVLFDNSYPTGGEAITAANFGLSRIDAVVVGSNSGAGVDAVWDAANSKLKLFDEDGTSGISAEFASTGDASANTATILVFGQL